ncbi:hypothetical protein K432DRAFT_13642 [Lepidopterella palustris CBS 459.81]|uniref:Nucleotide-diphospho-sugar transferase domain-containing protein n=1 Tax=Lepidopterella palustris CBS 459.81 TaxID=1314670 RepID=A0A8E2DX39_9PEZI|nr:hypothetical protein K432DRAFT_13642 [Lepidopterella palustris CBS 459.81]
MHTSHVKTLSLTDSIRGFYDALRLPVFAPSYTDSNGTIYELECDPLWTTSLGKDIIIVDIDTRVPTGFNQVFNNRTMDWERLGDGKYMDVDVGLTSEAVLNHYFYAQIHGYDYKFYQAEKIPDHHDSWVKVHGVAELLHEYRFVIFIDADAVIHHLEVPMEWLFNRWNITANTSIAMPVDVERDDCVTCDSKGKIMMNTGFIIAQQLDRTFDIFDAWMNCTDEKRYPGCAEWKTAWAHEQRAFSDYIRYEFDREEDVKEISCFDANGYPEKPDYVRTNCNGDFVRHHWVFKDVAKTAIGNSVMQSITEMLQKQILKEKEHIVVNKTKEAEENGEPRLVLDVAVDLSQDPDSRRLRRGMYR